MKIVFDGVLDWAIILALVGIFVKFYGKIVTLVKKDLVVNKEIEYSYGIIFLGYFVLIPLLLVMSLSNYKLFYLVPSLFWYMGGLVLTLIYFLLKKRVTSRFLLFSIGFITVFSMITSSYLFYLEDEIIYVLSSIILTLASLFVISTSMEKKKKIRVFLDNKEVVQGNLLHVGEDFIRVKDKTREGLAINKAHIIMVEEVREKK